MVFSKYLGKTSHRFQTHFTIGVNVSKSVLLKRYERRKCHTINNGKQRPSEAIFLNTVVWKISRMSGTSYFGPGRAGKESDKTIHFANPYTFDWNSIISPY